MRILPSEPVFTAADAHAVGCSTSALKHAVRRGRLIRVRRGVYARSEAASPLVEHEAVGVAHPDLPLSHLSSARLRGIPIVGQRAGGLPEVTVPPRANAHLPGIKPYRARLREHDVELFDGRLMTSIARTVIDLARDYPIQTSIPALDFVLHEKLATAEDLVDVLDFCRTWPGSRRARRAARLSDSRAESPLESVSRLVIPRIGLPTPEPQVVILDSFGNHLGRCDFYWDEFGVVGEADGRSKYAVDSSVGQAEKDREAALRRVRLELTRWDWTRVWAQHALLASGIRDAQRSGADRDRAGLPRGWTAERTPRVVVL